MNLWALANLPKENSIEESKECNPKYDDNTKDFERRE